MYFYPFIVASNGIKHTSFQFDLPRSSFDFKQHGTWINFTLWHGNLNCHWPTGLIWNWNWPPTTPLNPSFSVVQGKVSEGESKRQKVFINIQFWGKDSMGASSVELQLCGWSKKKKQPPSSAALWTLFSFHIDFYNTMIKVDFIVSVSWRRILEIHIPQRADFFFFLVHYCMYAFCL